MVADEERREVARKLREQDIAEFRESAIVPFLECLGIGYENWRGVLDRLAGLIDRPTCFDTENEDSKLFTCSACGFSDSKIAVNPFALSLRYVKPSYRYCPSCGAEVVK